MKQNIENITNKDIDTVNERITTLRNKRNLYIDNYYKKMEELNEGGNGMICNLINRLYTK